MTEPKHAGWLVSVRTIIGAIASFVVILSAFLGMTGWCIGLYEGLATRVTTLEIDSHHFSDDLRDIKSMLNQLLMGRADRNPDTQRLIR